MISSNAWFLVLIQNFAIPAVLPPHSATQVPRIEFQLSPRISLHHPRSHVQWSGLFQTTLGRPHFPKSYPVSMQVLESVGACPHRRCTKSWLGSSPRRRHHTQHSVPEYRSDNKLTSFGGIPRRVSVLQTKSRLCRNYALRLYGYTAPFRLM